MLVLASFDRYCSSSKSHRLNSRSTKRTAYISIIITTITATIYIPFGVVYFMNSFIPSTRTPDIIAIRFIFSIGVQLNYLLSFFLYILSGSVYREQLRRLFKFTRRQNHLNNTILNPQTEANHQYRFTKNNN
ncbi:hypothetical protein I4U23_022461 [Adineta vaga]|nr:hypothetical protein I4U23_022461 [Adineta vaga]